MTTRCDGSRRGTRGPSGRAGPRARRRPRHRRLQRRLRRPVSVDARHGRSSRRIIAASSAAAGPRRATTSPSPAPNDRVWNALEKLARARPGRRSPTTTPTTSSRWSPTAWLGPGYQVTSQVNVVNPGGAGADRAPRLPPGLPVADEVAARYPAHVHRLSPVLTLQGAVAHMRHAGRDRPDDVPAALPQVRARLPGLAAAGVPRVLRGEPRPAAAGRRATRCSSTRRCSTPRAPTAPPTSSAWPTCCRSRPRSGGRWRAVDRARDVAAVYPALLAARGRRGAGVSPT